MKITNPADNFSRLCRCLRSIDTNGARIGEASDPAGAQKKVFEMICLRCGTSRRPIGPRKRIDGWGRECLRYACDECGYSWNEPTADGARPHRSGVASLGFER